MSDRDSAVQVADVTATATGVHEPQVSETLVSSRVLVRETAGLRDSSRFLAQDATALHLQALSRNLAARTSARGRQGIQDLLSDLAQRGFAWSTIAALIGVSVPAVRKWRNGEASSGTNRLLTAGVVALCDLLETEYHVQDVASWFDMPLESGSAITPTTLHHLHRHDLLLDLASGRMDPAQILAEIAPTVGEVDGRFEVFEASDGMLSLRVRDN